MIARIKNFFTQEQKPFDTYFFWIVTILAIVGFFIFVSASLGVLARNEQKFYGTLINQLVLGLGGGFLGLYIASRIPYTFWKRHAFFIFLGSIVLVLLVFIPGLGYEHNGARRWISVFGVSFQPAEFLKLGTIIYFSAWLAWSKRIKTEFKGRVIPFLILLALVFSILYFQRDTKSFVLIFVAGISMLFVSGIAIKRMVIIGGLFLVAIGIIIGTRSYAQDRLQTFLNPSNDPQGASYQIIHSRIALGSGGVFGRGFGKSVQKFQYLPEPQGDSVFAVVGEELGYIGAVVIIIMYIFFAIRGFKIALRTEDYFARYFIVGVVMLLITQSFMNIASISGLIPLTGVPLVFISHGGTALALALISSGIILNISRNEKKRTS